MKASDDIREDTGKAERAARSKDRSRMERPVPQRGQARRVHPSHRTENDGLAGALPRTARVVHCSISPLYEVIFGYATAISDFGPKKSQSDLEGHEPISTLADGKNERLS